MNCLECKIKNKIVEAELDKLWCAKHLPTSFADVPVVRSACYLAGLNQTLGDLELGEGLRDWYLSFAKDFYTLDKKGKRQPQCSGFCGVSRYQTTDGMKTILILKDFFNPKPESFFITALI